MFGLHTVQGSSSRYHDIAASVCLLHDLRAAIRSRSQVTSHTTVVQHLGTNMQRRHESPRPNMPVHKCRGALARTSPIDNDKASLLRACLDTPSMESDSVFEDVLFLECHIRN